MQYKSAPTAAVATAIDRFCKLIVEIYNKIQTIVWFTHSIIAGGKHTTSTKFV